MNLYDIKTNDSTNTIKFNSIKNRVNETAIVAVVSKMTDKKPMERHLW